MSRQRRQHQEVNKSKTDKFGRVLAIFTVVTITLAIGLLVGQSCMDTTRLVLPEMPIDSLVVTPESVTVQVGDTVQLTAVVWAGGAIVACSGDCVSVSIHRTVRQVFMALRNQRPVEIEVQVKKKGDHVVLADGRPMRTLYSEGGR
jgi:plastocyanin